MLAQAAGAGAAPVGHGASAQCPPRNARVLRSDRQAFVYTIRESATETLETVHGESHYQVHFTAIRGCARRRVRSYKLGTPPEGHGGGGGSAGSGIRNLALNGSDVAFEESMTSSEGGEGGSHNEWLVVVRDLRNGRVLHKVPTGPTRASDPNNIGVGETTAIVVKSDGAVAWIAEAPGFYEVHALDRTGSRLLASGADIKPRVLGLHGSELYWYQGGKRMSALLD
ncbi:MAG: hypothetical protein ABSB69_04470 [Solirubrobacteraceae bacterium]